MLARNFTKSSVTFSGKTADGFGVLIQSRVIKVLTKTGYITSTEIQIVDKFEPNEFEEFENIVPGTIIYTEGDTLGFHVPVFFHIVKREGRKIKAFKLKTKITKRISLKKGICVPEKETPKKD